MMLLCNISSRDHLKFSYEHITKSLAKCKGNRQKLPNKFLKIPAQTGGQKCAMIAGISFRGIKNIQNVNKLTKNMFYSCRAQVPAPGNTPITGLHVRGIH
jgi:hypothetical protein